MPREKEKEREQKGAWNRNLRERKGGRRWSRRRLRPRVWAGCFGVSSCAAVHGWRINGDGVRGG